MIPEDDYVGGEWEDSPILDDYEEGIFYPNFPHSFASDAVVHYVNVPMAYYVKVGRYVQVTFGYHKKMSKWTLFKLWVKGWFR